MKKALYILYTTLCPIDFFTLGMLVCDEFVTAFNKKYMIQTVIKIIFPLTK